MLKITTIQKNFLKLIIKSTLKHIFKSLKEHKKNITFHTFESLKRKKKSNNSNYNSIKL